MTRLCCRSSFFCLEFCIPFCVFALSSLISYVFISLSCLDGDIGNTGYVWLTAYVRGRVLFFYLSVFFLLVEREAKNGMYAVLFSLHIGFLIVFVILTAGGWIVRDTSVFCPNFVFVFFLSFRPWWQIPTYSTRV